MKTPEQLVAEYHSQGLLLPIWMEGDRLKLIDQTKLPFTEEFLEVDRVEQLAEAIRNMHIRGSGALGIAGAWGLYLAARVSKGDHQEIQMAARLLKSTRPTAINLMKTVDEIAETVRGKGEECIHQVENKTVEILERQLAFEHRLGENGASLIRDGDVVMTHCHSGALAGSGYGGRALSVIRKAQEQGKKIHVLVSETRPYLQGARITAFELKRFGIPHTLITDNMSGYCMSRGMVQMVVVGSDRVAANGDLANKVGTYMHALAAREHGVPFYTATSSHTVDFRTPSGDRIEVEMRDAGEVIRVFDRVIAPEGTRALYPSFDITPHDLLSGIITEKGVITAPFEKNLLVLETASV